MVLGRKTNFFPRKKMVLDRKTNFFLGKRWFWAEKPTFPRGNPKNHLFGVWPHSFSKDVFFVFLFFLGKS